MKYLLGGSLGVLIAGPLGGLVGAFVPRLVSWTTRPREVAVPIRLVLMLLLVSLRSGRSVLASLVEVADALPDYRALRMVARVASVSGLVAALEYSDDELRPVLTQLSRAQQSGASLTGAVRRMLENGLAAQRTDRIARARTLPVRLMLPVTLLMLPGLVLFLYGPSLLAMFNDLTGALT